MRKIELSFQDDNKMKVLYFDYEKEDIVDFSRMFVKDIAGSFETTNLKLFYFDCAEDAEQIITTKKLLSWLIPRYNLPTVIKPKTEKYSVLVWYL